MDEAPPSSSSSYKRSFVDTDDSIKHLKRVRFPKGKKVKPESTPVQVEVNDDVHMSAPPDFPDPRIAAKERARCRDGIDTMSGDVTEVSESYFGCGSSLSGFGCELLA